MELRYREVYVQMGQDYGRVEKVLQFRHQVHPDQAPETYENGKAWSAWQDVPTVSGVQP